MKYSTDIYNIYLKYISSEDILVYSIDEVFCDITGYLNTYKLTKEELVSKIIKDVYNHTGITATAGIGTNMYLAKIAMDIVAKHARPNEIGVRMAYLDEMSYRKLLWNHKPLTSFWRIGKGIAKKLEDYTMHTMGDIARMSIEDENLLYKLFGVNAELIIDHAWGYEPTTIKDAKSYMPMNNSVSSGQVLHEPYDYIKTKLIVKEMMELLSLDLVKRKVVTNRLVLTINYDVSNLDNPSIKYSGEVVNDFYGRSVPKPAHGTINIDYKTSSTTVLTSKIIELYEKIINKNLLVRKINMAACDLTKESNNISNMVHKQLDLFGNNEEIEKEKKLKESTISEKNLQNAILNIKSKYGKNAILKGMNLESGGTTIQRNAQVGGHKE